MIRACLESRENDEDFFSASDGGECPSPPSYDDSPWEEETKPRATADDDDAVTTNGSIDDGEGRGEAEVGCTLAALPAHVGDASPPAAKECRRMSASTTSLPDGLAEIDDTLADERQRQTEQPQESNLMPREVRQSSGKDNGEPPAGTNVASFAGISVSGLRQTTGVSKLGVHSSSEVVEGCPGQT